MINGRHIIALGGGTFSMEADNGLLDKYILHCAPLMRDLRVDLCNEEKKVSNS